MDYFKENQNLTLAELEERMDMFYRKCFEISIDIHDAEEHYTSPKQLVAELKNELREAEEYLYDICHRALGLCLFKANKDCVEEFTFKLSHPINNFLQVSTIGGEGYIWFTDKNGVEVDDFDVEEPHLYGLVKDIIKMV